MMEKVTCECGSSTARCNMSHHRNTIKHKAWERERVSAEDLYDEIKILKLEVKQLKKRLDSIVEMI